MENKYDAFKALDSKTIQNILKTIVAASKLTSASTFIDHNIGALSSLSESHGINLHLNSNSSIATLSLPQDTPQHHALYLQFARAVFMDYSTRIAPAYIATKQQESLEAGAGQVIVEIHEWAMPDAELQAIISHHSPTIAAQRPSRATPVASSSNAAIASSSNGVISPYANVAVTPKLPPFSQAILPQNLGFAYKIQQPHAAPSSPSSTQNMIEIAQASQHILNLLPNVLTQAAHAAFPKKRSLPVEGNAILRQAMPTFDHTIVPLDIANDIALSASFTKALAQTLTPHMEIQKRANSTTGKKEKFITLAAPPSGHTAQSFYGNLVSQTLSSLGIPYVNKATAAQLSPAGM